MIEMARLLGLLLWTGTAAVVLAEGTDPSAAVRSFVAAAARGDLDAVNAALSQGIDVNARADYKWTALYAAAERSRIIVLRRLIEAGADVNAKEELGVTPLHWAAIRGPREAVKALIVAGADVNAYCVQHDTPLGAAAGAGNLAAAEELIAGSADVNGKRGMAPLALAAKYDRVPLIKLLVQHGANVNDTNNPPLHWAGRPGAARALLDAGAEVNLRNPEGQTVLHLSTGAWVPDASTVKLLIAAHADVNARCNKGSTPLHAAIRHKNLDIVRALIAAGASPDSKDNEGNTPLSLAKGAGKKFVAALSKAGAVDDGTTELQRAILAGDSSRARALIDGGADVNATGQRRMTAAHTASQSGRVDILRELLRAGAKVNARNEEGLRPLHFAADAVTAEVLIASGAEVNEPKDGGSSESPMYVAVSEGRADVVRTLIKHQAEVNPPDEWGPLAWAVFFGRPKVVTVLLEAGAIHQPEGILVYESALHVAAMGGLGDMASPEHVTPAVRLEIAKELIQKGADVNAKANIGYFFDCTPLTCAAMRGDVKMVKLLLDKGANVDYAPARGMYSGYTALHSAAEGNHLSVVNLLLSRRANVNALTGKECFQGIRTPLDIAESPRVRQVLARHGGKKASELVNGN